MRRLLRDNGTVVSKATTRKLISASGLTSAKPRYCQVVRDANKEKRVSFCESLIQANDTLGNVIFTDECTVQLHNNKVVVYRLKDASAPYVPKPKHPLKIHVWAGISKRGATQIVLFEGIMRKEFFVSEILENTLLPFIRQKFPDNHRFQQDNDPKHKSKLATEFLAENNIDWWRDWPSESCDLNPIEMVWNELKASVSKKNPRNKDELVSAITEFWGKTMTKDKCTKYIDHIYKVVPVCVFVNGKPTCDLPNRIFEEPSLGKSISYFNEKLNTLEMYQKAIRLTSRIDVSHV
ncbi:hypothetical protein FSP39_000486 [Pinctada imbricata]|uniref:Tc1-like transposase DDE domain-containing protein n=1 Tax=Pinctada imbricata TaxID=66713 RepID=A0AA89CD12_PINIB|nr:hypothetical protein FSP39_000486 [Pinctada imbricata]